MNYCNNLIVIQESKKESITMIKKLNEKESNCTQN